MEMNAEAWVALAALVVSLISLAVTMYEKLRSDQENLIKALQGQKENIAFTAIKVSSKQWQGNIFHESYKDDMIASLCLAWVMEGSDRARALVLSALKVLSEEASNKRKIAEILTVVEDQFKDYVKYAYANNQAAGNIKMKRGLDKAKQLRQALQIP